MACNVFDYCVVKSACLTELYIHKKEPGAWERPAFIPLFSLIKTRRDEARCDRCSFEGLGKEERTCFPTIAAGDMQGHPGLPP